MTGLVTVVALAGAAAGPVPAGRVLTGPGRVVAAPGMSALAGPGRYPAEPGPGPGAGRTLAVAGSPERLHLAADGTYRVSLDGGRTWSRPRPQARRIQLRDRTFDPRDGGMTLGRRADGGAYLLQFAGAPLPSQRAELTRLGVRLGAFVPDLAYVARMDPATRARVEALPYVRWVGGYEAADKYDPDPPAGRYAIATVERDAADQAEVAARVGALGGTVDVVSAGRRLVEATLTPAQVAGLAGLGAVLALDPVGEPGTDMDQAREDGGANAIETVGGYAGQGVRGEVMDGGLRATHQEFAARPPVTHGATGADPSHGTSTYGEIFASGVTPQARGLLPLGQGIIAAYPSVNDRWAHTAQLVDPAGPYRAVFQSNSWGGSLTTRYTTVSGALDDVVFDHDLLVCQSQSNAGSRSSRPEAWAKNVVSVGGQYHYDTLDRADDRWNGGASVGPAPDGRIKPDLSHYFDGIFTTSAASDTAYTPTFGGTSGATPITCGYFGLLYELWADGVFAGAPGQNRDVFDARPHAATARALMVNQANAYPFTGETADLTRVHQGWGTASVGNLYAQARANGWRLPVLVDESDPLAVGQRRAYPVTVDGGQPLRATMVYTDPQAAASAAVARVNDLSLRVTAPDGTVYWGDNGLRAGDWSTPGGVSNTVDTVENVLVEHPTPGTWTVEVLADEVNVDGHVETPETDADYALVVTGAQVPGPTPSPSPSPSPSPTPGPTISPTPTPAPTTPTTPPWHPPTWGPPPSPPARRP
ncbi:S8 family serine peptidase [Longispora sp. K20-0274]|uniref:S8 family serine peptidase n=1 Tax=Longispora sp. K20-0274 TaxID=3088255 RepID=UPI00399BACE1